MEKYDKDKIYGELYDCLAKISSPDDIKALLADLCTYNEVEQMAQRLLCAKLLLKGFSYSQIIELTDLSSATLSRVSRCIRHGSGGYSRVVGKMIEGEDDE